MASEETLTLIRKTAFQAYREGLEDIDEITDYINERAFDNNAYQERVNELEVRQFAQFVADLSEI